MYYAIREGAGVRSVIVESWEECKWLVYNYPVVYKRFKSRGQAESYLKLSDKDLIKQNYIKKRGLI